MKVRWATPNPRGDERQVGDPSGGKPDCGPALFQDLPQGDAAIGRGTMVAGKGVLGVRWNSNGAFEQEADLGSHHKYCDQLLSVSLARPPPRPGVSSHAPPLASYAPSLRAPCGKPWIPRFQVTSPSQEASDETLGSPPPPPG